MHELVTVNTILFLYLTVGQIVFNISFKKISDWNSVYVYSPMLNVQKHNPVASLLWTKTMKRKQKENIDLRRNECCCCRSVFCLRLVMKHKHSFFPCPYCHQYYQHPELLPFSPLSHVSLACSAHIKGRSNSNVGRSPAGICRHGILVWSI